MGGIVQTLPDELLQLIRQGEDTKIEYKEAKTDHRSHDKGRTWCTDRECEWPS